LEATDISPLLKNPKLQWDHPSLTTYGPGNHAVRSERRRYIRYNDNSEELYDHTVDPHEWKNLANDPKYMETKKTLAQWLPKVNKPFPLPDSASLKRMLKTAQDSLLFKKWVEQQQRQFIYIW
jgi:hypothetical protein